MRYGPMAKIESRHDIRQHSDQELSLIVLNTEHLYRAMHRSNFLDVIQDCYLYTDEQLEVLKADIAADSDTPNEIKFSNYKHSKSGNVNEDS